MTEADIKMLVGTATLAHLVARCISGNNADDSAVDSPCAVCLVAFVCLAAHVRCRRHRPSKPVIVRKGALMDDAVAPIWSCTHADFSDEVTKAGTGEIQS